MTRPPNAGRHVYLRDPFTPGETTQVKANVSKLPSLYVIVPFNRRRWEHYTIEVGVDVWTTEAEAYQEMGDTD